MAFEALKEVLERTLQLNVNLVMRSLFLQEDDLEDVIIELNTQDQLFDQGIDAKGVTLESIGGSYAPITVSIKRTEGLPFDRITLRDTGEFYKSFRVVVESDGFVIEADTLKNGVDLTTRWGNDILGLTDQSIEKLAFFIRPLVVEFVRQYMLGNARIA